MMTKRYKPSYYIGKQPLRRTVNYRIPSLAIERTDRVSSYKLGYNMKKFSCVSAICNSLVPLVLESGYGLNFGSWRGSSSIFTIDLLITFLLQIFIPWLPIFFDDHPVYTSWAVMRYSPAGSITGSTISWPSNTISTLSISAASLLSCITLASLILPLTAGLTRESAQGSSPSVISRNTRFEQ